MQLTQFDRVRLRAVLEQVKECVIPPNLQVSAQEFRFFFATITELIEDPETQDEATSIKQLIG